jgi:hypothetical protein
VISNEDVLQNVFVPILAEGMRAGLIVEAKPIQDFLCQRRSLERDPREIKGEGFAQA